jgi:hypothetical protein
MYHLCHSLVAVHGLNGDPRRTWTSKENNAQWLLEFVPRQFPGARVMSFGYNSAIGFSGSKMSIKDFARDLLNRLVAARCEDSKRPLIFVCHSLGGIVVKKALALAHEEDGQYGDVLSACAGIIFMGTPHRGSDAASWAEMLASIINAVSVSNLIRQDLLNTLKTTSKELEETSSQSLHRLSKFPIASVVECMPLPPLRENLVSRSTLVSY